MMDDIQKLKLLIFTPSHLQTFDSIDANKLSTVMSDHQQLISRQDWISAESTVPIILQLDEIVDRLTDGVNMELPQVKAKLAPEGKM